jgi:MFS family permease
MIGVARIGALLREPDYRRIWGAGVATGVCRWLEILAAGVYAYEVTGSPLLVAFLFFLRLTPLVLLGSVIGTFADRWSPKAFLVAGLALGAVAAAAIALLLILGRADYWTVAVAVLASGIVWSMDMPLRRRMLGDVAGPERLVTALSFDGATNNATRAFGPFLGGILYQAFGAAGAFSLTATLYAIGLILVLRAGLGGARSGKTAAATTRILADFREAFSLVVKDKDILRILLVTAVFNVFCLPFISMIPVLGEETLHLSAGWIGVLAALEGGGALIGALTLTIANPPIGTRRIYFFGVLFYVVFAFVAGFMTLAVPMAAVILFIGLSAGAFTATQAPLVYSVAPPHMRSRIFGVLAICIGIGIVGVANIGLMAEWLGTPVAVRVVAIEGIVAMLLIGVGWRELWDRSRG